MNNSLYRKTYGRYNTAPDFTRCCEEINDGNWNWTQCSRKRGFGEHEAYCRQHDPVAVSKRDEEAQRLHRESAEAERPKFYGTKFLKVLREIAAGHNDARALAQAAIDEFDRKKLT